MSFKHRREAIKDLFKRYRDVFAHVWQYRDELEPKGYSRQEAQFLPAALELQEMPVSPAPRVAMGLIIAFATIALLWACFGKIDMVASAHGKIVPNDRTKTIQPIETSTVKAIHVTDGQTIKAGDILVELDSTSEKADQDHIASDLAVARLQVARAKALLEALDKNTRPQLTRPADVSEKDFSEAQALVAGQYTELQTKLAQIDATLTKHAAEQRSVLALVHTLQKTVPITREKELNYKSLVNQDFVSKHGYLEQEQTRIEHEGDLANQQSRLKEIDASLLETKSQRANLMAETRRINLDSINDGTQKAASLAQDLVKANEHYKLMTLRAPVSGTVQQLAIHTVGGVVTPAQALMLIVPTNNSLEVEAFLENKDIGFVKVGQTAAVKVETFPYTKYGTINSIITSVSHDAINDEKRGLIYSIRVKMNRSSINVDGTRVNLSPGMAVTAEIKTGKRRVIEYFLSPLLQHGNESLHER